MIGVAVVWALATVGWVALAGSHYTVAGIGFVGALLAVGLTLIYYWTEEGA